MKIHYYLSLALLLATNVLGQIAGTTTVYGPVAPPATNSLFGGATSKYFTGGYQEWFANTGDWTNRNYLPLGRMVVGMLVSAQDNTEDIYRLTDLSPETWTLFSDADKIDRIGGTFQNLNGTNFYLPSQPPNRAAIINGSAGVASSTVTTTQLEGFDGRLVSLESGVKTDITVVSPSSYVINARAVTFPKLPEAAAASLMGRRSGSTGDFENITLGANLSMSSGGVLSAGTNTTLNTYGGVGTVSTMAELVAAAQTTNHASAYYVNGYWTNNVGVGNGIWYYSATADWPTNRAIIASTNGGQFLPAFYNDMIDVTRFGALTFGTTTENNQAFVDAWYLQQQRCWQEKTLFVPTGAYSITTGFAVRTGGTGSGYLTTSTNAIGTQVINVNTGSGTIIVGDTIQFSNAEIDNEYRVIAALGGGNFTIAYPGLRAGVASGTAVYVRNESRWVMKGVNNGVQQDPGERAEATSELYMVTDNIPIMQIKKDHGLIENLTLAYDTFQSTNDTSAACIYNAPSDRLYQWKIKGVSMIRGGYGIHIADGSSGVSAPNNVYEDILVRSSSVQPIRIGKSGTANRFDWWYIQSNNNSTDGVSHLQTITNISKSGTQLTCVFGTLPGSMQVGSWADFTFTGQSAFDDQYVIKTCTNTTVTIDLTTALATNSLVATTGTANNVAKSRLEAPLVYISAGCEFDASAMDFEGTVGAATDNVPLALDNRGNGFIGMYHSEYLISRANTCVIRNGGMLGIGVMRMINSGRLAEKTVYLFENNTSDLTGSGTLGAFHIGSFGIYGLSTMTSSGGTWAIATNKNGAPPVVIGQYVKFVSPARPNTTNAWPVGTALTYTTGALPP